MSLAIPTMVGLCLQVHSYYRRDLRRKTEWLPRHSVFQPFSRANACGAVSHTFDHDVPESPALITDSANYV